MEDVCKERDLCPGDIRVVHGRFDEEDENEGEKVIDGSDEGRSDV